MIPFSMSGTNRIGIVGSGDGGTLVANLLSSKLRSEISHGTVSIELFGKHQAHVFQPGNLDVAFRGARPENYVKEESSLLRHNVSFRAEEVKALSLGDRSVTLAGGETRYFDHLILATGSEIFPESIEGLSESALLFHKGPFDSRRAWLALERFKAGKIVILIGGVPHKCPPSPNEAAFLIDEYLRKKGIRNQCEIKLLTPYPRAYPAAEIAKTVQTLFDEKGIEVVPFFNLDFVNPNQKTVSSFEGEKFDYDLLFAVPPHRGAKVIRDSGIGKPDEGWIPTDKYKLNVKDYDNVYAIGDATDIPISKSGVVAHLESVLLSTNLAQEIAGRSEEPELYNGRINCPMEVGGKRAIFVSATYTKPPKKQNPSFTKYIMKKGFGMLYWSAMEGTWEPLFKLYFGKTSTRENEKEHITLPTNPAIPSSIPN
jgi:sulfide:quinone oxidoreductase